MPKKTSKRRSPTLEELVRTAHKSGARVSFSLTQKLPFRLNDTIRCKLNGETFTVVSVDGDRARAVPCTTAVFLTPASAEFYEKV